METHTQSKFGKWAVIIAIVIVLNLFFNYAISLVYKAPDFQAFCPTTQVEEPATTKDQCVAEGGQWTTQYYSDIKTVPVDPNGKAITGYCNPNYTCQNSYQKASEVYSRNVFITLVVLGLVSVILGIFAGQNQVVSNGLSFGGVLSFIIASMRYWSSADNWIKVAILAVALGLLIWIAIKKFKE